MKFRGWRFFIGCGCLEFMPAGVLVPLLETGSHISRHSHVNINIVIVCAREWCRVIVDDPAHLNIPFPITKCTCIFKASQLAFGKNIKSILSNTHST